MEKKSSRDKNFKKYWTGILGKTLYFYDYYKDIQDVEQLDLENCVSLTDDSSRINQKEHRLILKLKGMEVKLKVESLELRELWKGFILTVIKLMVPTNLVLLPGHLCMLREALEKEKQRLNELQDSQQVQADDEGKPSCFCNVSRMEAQELLEKNPTCGNLLVRPGSDPASFSISICHIHCGHSTTKHYKVKWEKQYILQVEPPMCFSSLTDIVDYFVSNTNAVPFEWDLNYEEKITWPEVDKESGEHVLQNNPILPSPVSLKKSNERVPPAIPTDPLPSDEEDMYEPIDEDNNKYINPEPRHSTVQRSLPLKPPTPSPVNPRIPMNVTVRPNILTNVTVRPNIPTTATVRPRIPIHATARPTLVEGMTPELREKLMKQRMKLEGLMEGDKSRPLLH